MSALEQIRQRPILIISILGVALLLFILTAVDRPGELFTDTHTVAKVDGQKIDYIEFQRRVEQQSEQMRQQGYTNVDLARVQTMVLQQMVNETLLNHEYEKLGLVVTDKELTNAMLGETPHPMVMQMVQQMGFPSPKDFYNYAYNSTQYGLDAAQAQQLQQYWQQLETQTEQMLLAAKFGDLFTGTLTANELDARAYFNDNASTATIAYARTDYSTLSGDEYNATPAEIEALYKEEQNRFRISEPQYLIDYIAVPIVPSKGDLDAAAKEVAEALAGLKAHQGLEAVDGNSHFYVNRVSAPKGDLATSLRTQLDKIVADSVCQVSFYDYKYTLAKFMGSTQQADSVMISTAQFAENADADSVLNLLNSGAAPKDLGEKLIAHTTDSIWIRLTDANFSAVKDDIAQAESGKYFVGKNTPGVAIKVVNRKAPVTVYDIAEITYQVDPSTAAYNQLTSDFQKFLATNNTPEKFNSEAEKAGYNVMEGIVTPSTLTIGQIPDTRNAAKWTVNNKAGKVSEIYNTPDKSVLLAVAIKDVYKGDFIPATNQRVKDYLSDKVTNRKKGEKLVATYKGKASNVAGYATAMKTSVDTTQVTFGQPMVRNFPPYESALNANVAVAKKGQVVGPVALNNSVVVFEVVNVDNSGREFDYTNDAMVFNQREGNVVLQNNISAILLGKKKVDNRILKFASDNND